MRPARELQEERGKHALARQRARREAPGRAGCGAVPGQIPSINSERDKRSNPWHVRPSPEHAPIFSAGLTWNLCRQAAEGLSPPAAPFCGPAKSSSPGSFLGEKMCQKESGGGLRGSPATPSSLPFRLLKGAGQGIGAGRGASEATLAPNKVRPAPSLRNCPGAPLPPESVPAACPASASQV